ncbi:MAG: AAA family ATPase (plasmid) [Nodularia sp. CChRGM 3473]
MNFSAKSTTFFSVIPQEQRLNEQICSTGVTFEEALVTLNNLVLDQRRRCLSEAEILVIQGAWNDIEYEEIANNSTYSRNYLQRRVAPPLWIMLSKIIGNGERVGKKSLRYFLEKVTKEYQNQDTLKEQISPDNNLIQIMGTKLPDVSSFYGRTRELSFLKELIIKQRCVLLSGVAGIGKSTLAAKLLTQLSIESPPQFDCLIWKSVAHAPILQDLVAELLEIINPLEPESSPPKYTQAILSMLIKQLQSRRCLLVLDTSEALFQNTNFQQRLEYGLFFRRLTEEISQSCVLLTSRFLPDEIDSLIAAELPVGFLRIEGLDVDAAMQVLSSKGLTDIEQCSELIKTYRGNPSELKAVVNRIHHFFASSTEKFLENPTTLVSDQFQEMLNQVFSQKGLSEIHRQIMIYLAEKLTLNEESVSFAKILMDMNNKQREFISTSELIRALERLEKDSLIESKKDSVTKEISFTLQPVIKKYIVTDPLGLVHNSSSSNFKIAS